MMPVMGGVELIARLRSDPETSRSLWWSYSPRARSGRTWSMPSSRAFEPAELLETYGPRSRGRLRWSDSRPGSMDSTSPGGGVPSGSLVVLAGGPGTGKTILAQQICFAIGRPERKAIYYTTLSEPHDKLVRHLEPFDFFDSGALGDRVEFVHLGDLMPDAEKSQRSRRNRHRDLADVPRDEACRDRDRQHEGAPRCR